MQIFFCNQKYQNIFARTGFIKVFQIEPVSPLVFLDVSIKKKKHIWLF
jgi:hypothetical protein